jgi:hypothetical protein
VVSLTANHLHAPCNGSLTMNKRKYEKLELFATRFSIEYPDNELVSVLQKLLKLLSVTDSTERSSHENLIVSHVVIKLRAF